MRIHMQSFIHDMVTNKAWVDNNNRYGIGKTKSNPKTGECNSTANVIQGARLTDNPTHRL